MQYAFVDEAPEAEFPNAGMPQDPNYCYAKCLMPNQYETEEIEYFEYTGNQFDADYIKKRKVITKPSSTRWEKKKADKNCLSANPEDCLTWCLEEIPEEFESFYEVTDLSKTDEFNLRIVEVQYLKMEGGFTEWRQVVCEKDLSSNLIKHVKEALVSFDYNIGIDATILEFGSASKAALVKYQKANGLPIGNLDFNTLEHLGIDISSYK